MGSEMCIRDRVPAALIDRPAGRLAFDASAIVKESPWSVSLKNEASAKGVTAVPTTPAWSAIEPLTTGGLFGMAVTDTVNALDETLLPAESVAVITIVLLPIAVGVPEITPVALLILTFAGKPLAENVKASPSGSVNVPEIGNRAVPAVTFCEATVPENTGA